MSITAGTYTIGSGKDYASLNAAEADIDAGGLTGALTFEYQEAMLDNTSVTFSFTANGYDLKVTVQDGYRFYDQTGWPNCAAVEGSGARLIASSGYSLIANTAIEVEWLSISAAASQVGFDDNVGCTVHNCILYDTGSVPYRADSGTSTMYNCFVYGTSANGVRCAGATLTVYNTTIYGTGATGFLQVSGTLNCYNCVSLDNTVADFGGTVGGDYNISSDTSAPGSGAEGTTHWHSKTWQEVIANGNPGEEDLHLTASREWAAGLIAGSNFESGSFGGLLTVGTDLTTSTEQAARGTYSGKALIDSTDLRILYYDFGSDVSATYPTTYTSWYCYPDSTFAMSDGDIFILAEQYFSGTVQWKVLCRRSGSDIQLALYYNGSNSVETNGTQVGSWITISTGAWLWLKVYFLKNASGAVEWWIDGVSKGSAAADTSGGSNMLLRYVAPLRLTALDAGTSGPIYVDHLQVSTADHVEPDDSTSPYGDSAFTDFPGGSYGYVTDIDGETVSDGYIGADGAVAAGGVANMYYILAQQ